MEEILSYGQIIKEQLEFRKSGTRSGDDFNLFDTPSRKYFKILFYFGDKSSESNKEIGQSNGLLHPTWAIFENNSQDNFNDSNLEKPVSLIEPLQYYDYNSAWSFLKRNDENERAEKLKKFIMLLSNINSCSPWYFTSISGLDTAMERKGPADGKIEIGDPGKLTITCLPDAFDNRIGTLLELYRDITWSWIQKKEIIPSNLRKFDMAIYIFESPIHFWHDKENTYIGKNNLDNPNEYYYKPSYKMLEFHDCEFNYNSIKSGWGELNNQTGVSPTYSIEISYNDCYEISYNEHLMRTIGDVIKTDTYNVVIEDNALIFGDSIDSKEQKDDAIQSIKIDERINITSDSALFNSIDQIGNAGLSFVKNKLTNAVLGNLYTYSLTKLGTQLSELEKGNIIKTGQSVKQYIDNAQERAAAKIKNRPSGEIFDSTPRSFKGIGRSLGNLANKIAPSTITNN